MVKFLRSHANVIYVTILLLALWGAAYAKDAHTQAIQQRQGQLIEKRLCHTLHTLAALHPPTADNAAANPSRQYLQNQHDVLASLGPDVGCR